MQILGLRMNNLLVVILESSLCRSRHLQKGRALKFGSAPRLGQGIRRPYASHSGSQKTLAWER